MDLSSFLLYVGLGGLGSVVVYWTGQACPLRLVCSGPIPPCTPPRWPWEGDPFAPENTSPLSGTLWGQGGLEAKEARRVRRSEQSPPGTKGFPAKGG